MRTANQGLSLNTCLLDKLLDDEPGKQMELMPSPAQQLHALYNSVRRDLEALLNTRAPDCDWPAAYQHLNQSLVNYGVPDFMSESMVAKTQQDQFCRELAICIERFEPRLKKVRVDLMDSAARADRMIKIRIHAILMLQPHPEQIVLDSVLDPDTNRIGFI